jgi:LysR family glycine cleavage system transcriptional activator
VRFGRPPFGTELNASLLFENVIVAVGSPLLIEKLGNPKKDENLSRYRLLHDAHNLWPLFLEKEMRAGSPPAAKKNIRFNQTALAIDAAIAGQGLALAGLLYVEDDIASGRLIRVLGKELRVGSDFYLLAPSTRKCPKSVTAVSDWPERSSSI